MWEICLRNVQIHKYWKHLYVHFSCNRGILLWKRMLLCYIHRAYAGNILCQYFPPEIIRTIIMLTEKIDTQGLADTHEASGDTRSYTKPHDTHTDCVRRVCGASKHIYHPSYASWRYRANLSVSSLLSIYILAQIDLKLLINSKY